MNSAAQACRCYGNQEVFQKLQHYLEQLLLHENHKIQAQSINVAMHAIKLWTVVEHLVGFQYGPCTHAVTWSNSHTPCYRVHAQEPSSPAQMKARQHAKTLWQPSPEVL